jgi:hypothetical protein
VCFPVNKAAVNRDIEVFVQNQLCSPANASLFSLPAESKARVEEVLGQKANAMFVSSPSARREEIR